MDEASPKNQAKSVSVWSRLTIAAVIISTSVFLLGIILVANIGANDELGDITSKLTSTESNTVTFENGTTITTVAYVTPPESLSQILKDLTQTRKDTNQQMLTTLMTAISAWVGAIIAFYFGKDYLVKLAESNKELIVANTQIASQRGNKPKIETIGNLLSQKPDASYVESYQLEGKIDAEKMEKSLAKYGSTFLFTKDDEKFVEPYGMLYNSGWKEANRTLEYVTLINEMKQSRETKLTTIDEDIAKLKEELAAAPDPDKQEELAELEKSKVDEQNEINNLDEKIETIAKKIGMDTESFDSLIKEIGSKKSVLNLVHDKISGTLWNEQSGFDNFKKASPSDKIDVTLKSMKDTFDSKVIGNTFVIIFSDDDQLRGILGYSDLVNASETAS